MPMVYIGRGLQLLQSWRSSALHILLSDFSATDNICSLFIQRFIWQTQQPNQWLLFGATRWQQQNPICELEFPCYGCMFIVRTAGYRGGYRISHVWGAHYEMEKCVRSIQFLHIIPTGVSRIVDTGLLDCWMGNFWGLHPLIMTGAGPHAWTIYCSLLLSSIIIVSTR